jgi:predicted dehydrogenase
MENDLPVRFVTLDPGHFHAALVQKSMYPGVDSTVHVYAPEGEDVAQHLARVVRYNEGPQSTAWRNEVYTGTDFLERMLGEKKGNVVVLSGNNGRKTEYITAAVGAGFSVLADKPMVIEPEELDELKTAVVTAEANGQLVYDIMTERFEITTRLQRALARVPALFGELERGSLADPAISKESVHHFSKRVSGRQLIRPAWFFDVSQQGEGMVDVATHLVDLILWETFPGQPIPEQEVEVVGARRWATPISRERFARVTGGSEFPGYLTESVAGDSLKVFSNGAIDFTVRGVHGRAAVIWNYEAPPGAADIHYSMMRGSRANLVIRQDAAEDYVATLYVEPTADAFDISILEDALATLQDDFPGVGYRSTANGAYVITIPDRLRVGHEAHFAQVTEQFLDYLSDGELPEWERTNMLTKYAITMAAYRKSR